MNITPPTPPRNGRPPAGAGPTAGASAKGARPTTLRVNHQIRIPRILVIDQHGTKLGEMTPEDAREMAESAGLDLVEIVPHARPPVCRIMDYGKYKYEESKKKKQHSRTAKTEVKTITLRPKTDTHDLNTKLAHARKFLQDGNRVKFVMRMRGREQAHTRMWEEKMGEIISALQELSQVVASPRQEGRTITAMVEPLATRSAPKA